MPSQRQTTAAAYIATPNHRGGMPSHGHVPAQRQTIAQRRIMRIRLEQGVGLSG
ncbi:MAG: hypothetical protein WCX93_00060 [Burkholderiaceae bacterium]